MNIAKAIAAMRDGEKVCRKGWREAWEGTTDPTYLVLIPGRKLTATYEPMVNHLGKDAEFTVRDHVDAIYRSGSTHRCVVGYQFTQADILTDDWRIVL